MLSDSKEILLATKDLRKYFPIRRNFNPFFKGEHQCVKAVDGVTISIPRGKTFAVIGESGCGKTTLARTIAHLTHPTSGEVLFEGKRIGDGAMKGKEVYRNIQIVFQDPGSSLDPTKTIADSVSEPIRGLLGGTNSAIKERVLRSLEVVGLSEEQAYRLPGRVSGGQRQLVAIARAISPSPKLLILDEPTSSLDVSIQARILQVLIKMQEQLGLAYMLITHNISLVQYLSDVMAVMYAGRVVEYGPTKKVLTSPRHPYTVELMNAAPIANPWKRNLLNVEITGDMPSFIHPPSGCRFNPRCPYTAEICRYIDPALEEVSSGHFAACHFKEENQ